MQAHTAANVLGALAHTLHGEVCAALGEDRGLSPSAAAALVHLSKYPGTAIEALRHPLGISHSACVRLVDRLEREGWLLRRRGADARTRTLALTASGRAEARALLASRERTLLRAVSALDATEREILVDLVSRILIDVIHGPDDALSVCRLCDYERCPDDVCPSARALAGDG